MQNCRRSFHRERLQCAHRGRAVSTSRCHLFFLFCFAAPAAISALIQAFAFFSHSLRVLCFRHVFEFFEHTPFGKTVPQELKHQFVHLFKVKPMGKGEGSVPCVRLRQRSAWHERVCTSCGTEEHLRHRTPTSGTTSTARHQTWHGPNCIGRVTLAMSRLPQPPAAQAPGSLFSPPKSALLVPIVQRLVHHTILQGCGTCFGGRWIQQL